MSSSRPTATPTPSDEIKPPTRSRREGRVLVLSVDGSKLARFPAYRPASLKASDAAAASASSKKTKAIPSHAEDASDTNATPAPDQATDDPSTADGANPLKRRGGPGQKQNPAKKVAMGNDADTKPKTKPGPKRRTKDTETNGKGPFSGPAPVIGHKLGPKANQGAINAGLRALDRTRKPCRKWDRKEFQLKSFTGVAWSAPSWRTPQAQNFGDVKSDSAGSSDVKPGMNSSAVGSEKSNSGRDSNALPAPADMASSPAQLPPVNGEVALPA